MSTRIEPELWLGGRLKLHQAARGAHRAGTDAALLASLIALEEGEVVYDLGAGTGAVGLAAALLSPGCRVVLVERDRGIADLADANVALNGLESRADVVVSDLLAPGTQRRADGLEANCADVVLTNPPFFSREDHRASPVPGKAQAHDFSGRDGLDGWLRACADILRPGGRLGLIHRADALPECLSLMSGRFGGVTTRPVHPRADTQAIRILVTAIKGSRAPFVILPPLVLHDETGRFTPESEAIHQGRLGSGIRAAYQ